MKNKVKDMREGCLDRMNLRYFNKSTQIDELVILN